MFVPITLTEKTSVPCKGTPASAGYDLCVTETLTLQPGERVAAPTGIRLAIPEGYYGRIAERSGLALTRGLAVMGGVIDADYRGEIRVILVNIDPQASITLDAGTRITQLLIERCFDVEFIVVESLPGSERGAGGFGSTGK